MNFATLLQPLHRDAAPSKATTPGDAMPVSRQERTKTPTKVPASGETTPVTRPVPTPTVAPAMDIHETTRAVVMYADMPGVDQSGVDLTIDRGVLTVRGHTKQSVPTGFTAVYQEYVPAEYERRFTLSDAIDCARITAAITNGVLRIELPKAEQAVPRKITVTSA